MAVSDSPAGPFEFYGHIRYPESIRNGKELNEYLPFDPAVLVDDDGKVWLYYGFCPEIDMEKPDMGVEEKTGNGHQPGSYGGRVGAGYAYFEGRAGNDGSGTEAGERHRVRGHGFFEASSIVEKWERSITYVLFQPFKP